MATGDLAQRLREEWDKLPEMVGEQWAELEPELRDELALFDAAAEAERDQAGMSLYGLLMTEARHLLDQLEIEPAMLELGEGRRDYSPVPGQGGGIGAQTCCFVCPRFPAAHPMRILPSYSAPYCSRCGRAMIKR